MNRVVLGLVLAFTIGCAADPDDCQPGDIDCAPDTDAGGKADGYNTLNDPVRMSQRLTYKLSELPKQGSLRKPAWRDQYPDAVGRVPVAWADTYWPALAGSHNARWMGATVKSPMEKYDQAFNDAAGCATMPPISGAGVNVKWDAYYGCAGPAARWQSKLYQHGGDMHDGIDNDGDGVVDGFGPSGDLDGIAGWWGTCHAWSPAALVVPEPQHAVTVNGVKFEVGDIKALIQNTYDGTQSVMLGGRCNAQVIEHSTTGSANDACADVNPGALHVVMTNFLGMAQLPLIEDRTQNYEVWNQPVVGYEVTKQTKVSASDANACVGATGSSWTYNREAKDLYEVRMTVKYVTEGDASAMPLGFENNTSTDSYHYILEVGSTGKVIGGRYCRDSDDTHIDFLWSPTGRHAASNPHVDGAKVMELIAKSLTPQSGGTSGGVTQKFTASPGVTIPDNKPAGVTANIPVSGVTGSKALTVSVDITHTYRGDLKVTLLRDGATIKVLADRAGGSQQNLVQSYTLTAAEAGVANGTWALKVVDTSVQDVGTFNTVTLSFE